MIYDLCIIGGGAAGLMAACQVSSAEKNCLLLEKMEKTGRKIRISGKGRCNITNLRGRQDFLDHVEHGKEIVSVAYDCFTPQETIDFLHSINLDTIQERGGRVFPSSGKAWDVAQSLLDFARKNKAEIHCDSKVLEIKKSGNVFEITTERGSIFRSHFILIATGGVSYPSTGSTGDGYKFAWKFGHNIVPVRPALTHLQVRSRCKEILLKNVMVSIEVSGTVVSTQFGEAEFNDRGLAGAAVLSQSRQAVDGILDGKKVAVIIDLKPALTHKQIEKKIESTGINSLDVVRKLIPGVIAKEVISRCNSVNDIPKVLKSFKIDVTGYGDFDYAIVTAGGVRNEEINPQTMESKLCNGLFFAGEVMDIDAKTGGYNIQIAFSTAFLASNEIIKRL